MNLDILKSNSQLIQIIRQSCTWTPVYFDIVPFPLLLPRFLLYIVLQHIAIRITVMMLHIWTMLLLLIISRNFSLVSVPGKISVYLNNWFVFIVMEAGNFITDETFFKAMC